MKKTAEERLSDLLDEKEERVEELESQVERLEIFNSLVDTAYQRHFTIPNSGIREGLPYPRLEMIFEYIDDDMRYGHKWTYGIVMMRYSFLDDKNLLFMPLSWTKGNGSIELIRGGKHELPHKDGMDMKAESIATGFPAYIINEKENHCELVEAKDGDIGNSKWVKNMRKQVINE